MCKACWVANFLLLKCYLYCFGCRLYLNDSKNEVNNQGLYWEVPFLSLPHLHLFPLHHATKCFYWFLWILPVFFYVNTREWRYVPLSLPSFIQKVLYYRHFSFSYSFSLNGISWRSSHISIYREVPHGFLKQVCGAALYGLPQLI